MLLGSQRARSLKGVEKVLVDSAYRGTLVQWAEDELGWKVEVVARTPSGQWLAPNAQPHPPNGFKLLKWRWIVERTFAWMGRCRRLSKDYEASTHSSEAWMLLSMIALLTRRIASS